MLMLVVEFGSKTPTVRQNYITLCLFRQMKETLEDFPADLAEERFSVMYLSLRTQGVQQYLHINPMAEPSEAREPVPSERQGQLENFALWVFGDKKRPPLFTDSRSVDQFGKILENNDAVAYLESAARPDFEYARRISGTDLDEIITLLRQAGDNIELSLSRVHFYKEDDNIQKQVRRLNIDVRQLVAAVSDLHQDTISSD